MTSGKATDARKSRSPSNKAKPQDVVAKPKEHPQDLRAGQSGKTVVVSQPKTTTVQHNKEHKMSDTRSIVEYSVDITEQDAPVPLPAKQYPFEIRSAEVKTSSNTGNDYYTIGVYISPDDYPADYVEGDPDGTLLSYNRLSASDKAGARYRVKKFCAAIGAKTSRRIDVTEWIGLTGICEVGTEEYEGEKRAVVTKIIANE